MMRQAYNSSDYWKEQITRSKTLRGRMFLEEPITNKTVYLHSLIFCKNTGIENLWMPIPSIKFLVGYIEYSFLQEAFYKWAFCGKGNDKPSIDISNRYTEEIITLAIKNNKISKTEANNMKRHLSMVKKCWDLSNEEILTELKKFTRDFNKTWLGDNTEFLYLKIFSNPKELADFVIDTTNMTSIGEKFEKELGVDQEGFRKICLMASEDSECEKKLKNILSRKLTEIL
ncbi:hypothetical protein [Clostridium sp. YIM B02551]|uniref:hypothetical protein n=1 Tax=Clostridium sp. YIM B02551 TaxID=2910679 RepID=UPI001EEABD36|nr:hypothetical protein [Clostridium sp. YIM B02551]